MPESNQQLIRNILAKVKDGSFARELVHDQQQCYARLRGMSDDARRNSLSQADRKLAALIRQAPINGK